MQLSKRQIQNKRTQNDARTKINRKPCRVAFSEKSLHFSLLGFSSLSRSSASAWMKNVSNLGASLSFAKEKEFKNFSVVNYDLFNLSWLANCEGLI